MWLIRRFLIFLFLKRSERNSKLSVKSLCTFPTQTPWRWLIKFEVVTLKHTAGCAWFQCLSVPIRKSKRCIQSINHLTIFTSVQDDKLEDLKATKKKIVSFHSSQCTFNHAPLMTSEHKHKEHFFHPSLYFHNTFPLNCNFCLVLAGGGYGDGNIQKCQSHPGKIWSWSKEKNRECSFLPLKFKAGLPFWNCFVLNVIDVLL